MFYECILMLPDVPTKCILDLMENIKDMMEKEQGQLYCAEYWGFRTLAYRIQKKGKAHYFCLGFELRCLKALSHYLKFHRDVLRFMCFQRPKGLQFPTLLAQGQLETIEKNKPLFSSKESGDSRIEDLFIAAVAPEEGHLDVPSKKENVPFAGKEEEIDYKNLKLLKNCLTEHEKIIPARLLRFSRSKQRCVAKAIKTARLLALLPFTAS